MREAEGALQPAYGLRFVLPPSVAPRPDEEIPLVEGLTQLGEQHLRQGRVAGLEPRLHDAFESRTPGLGEEPIRLRHLVGARGGPGALPSCEQVGSGAARL